MNIFSPADILLPPYETNDERWTSYSVIACDQFTGETSYWANAEKIVGDNLSTLNFILPEAYLETDREAILKAEIERNMKNAKSALKAYNNCIIYLERTLPDGRIRHGLVGKIDLENYDYSEGSSSAVRPTEKTVIERVPPRVEVRSKASVEFPHVMVFSDDKDNKILSSFSKSDCKLVYDFKLMLGGGHVKGWAVENKQLSSLLNAIKEYENGRTGVVYAVGDGNHSLAAAKSHYENIKKALGNNAKDHPARYALCEIVNIHDEAIEFEPIYRIVNNCDVDKLLNAFNNAKKSNTNIDIYIKGRKTTVSAPDGHALVVGSLQQFLDNYINNEENTAKCDYIHGVDSLIELTNADNSIGFVFEGMEKDTLFDYVEKNGVLPRKTFSMGEAKSKRYYLESRDILCC